ncbi:aspartyl protease family protein [Sphingomonas sp. 28-63-12]|uniref:aspartyl protease family protein n=1 Tax=Sphingomonas sp. 28-63-12 TaxID=1970434 RepID=UPI000BD96C2A|nr:MAG: hypothetical protein B7Y47_08265 [Sphingomonas sp. 28-63-12]
MSRLPILFALSLIGAAPPPSTAVSTLAADSEARWVPFDLTPGNQIRFTVAINGVAATAILDTGVSASVISRSFAATYRMRVQPRGNASAIGGNVAIGWTPTQNIAFGGMVRHGGGITVTALPAIATGSTHPVDVLVGHDLIDAYAIDIDFEGMRFRLLKSGQLPFRGTSAPLSIAANQNVYVTEAVLGGRRLTPMVVDTGDGSSITLSQESFRAARVVGLPTTTTIAYGLGGPLVTDLAIVPSLTIGKLTASNVEIRVERRGGFSQQIGAAGRIGSGFLQHYRVLLDPAAGHVVFGPTSQTGMPPMRSTSGILVATETARLRVLHVMRGSPAEATGWRAGDLICAIDGTPVPTDYSGSEISSWSIGSPGRVVQLSGCDGTERRLKLGNFY